MIICYKKNSENILGKNMLLNKGKMKVLIAPQTTGPCKCAKKTLTLAGIRRFTIVASEDDLKLVNRNGLLIR